jgi:hypothetical protein
MHTSQYNKQSAQILTLEFIAWTSKLAKHKPKQTKQFCFGRQSALPL